MADRLTGRALAAAILTVALVAATPRAEDVVAYSIVDAREVPDSLTGAPGDPQAGRELYGDQQLTRCSGCHGKLAEPAANGAPGRPDVPALDKVGKRLSEGAIRLWLIAPQVISPGTSMPGYYLIGQRDDPADPRYGEPLLTASQIEDLVAYLKQQSGDQ